MLQLWQTGHMVKDCLIRRSQEQGKERVQPNGPSEEAPRRQRFFALKSRCEGEVTSGEVSCEYLYLLLQVFDCVLCVWTSMRLICLSHHVGC